MNENTERTICAICGEEHDTDDMTLTSEGYVCQNCLDDEFIQCERCGEWVRSEDAYEVSQSWPRNSEYWCESCTEWYAHRCERCEEWFAEDAGYTDDHGTAVCDSCYNDYYRTCNECGSIIHEDDAYWTDDECYCWDCYHSLPAETINNYSYKPEPQFASRRNEAGNHLKFGHELEVDCGNDPEATARAITDAAEGRIYCKHDGSLSDGFEIVTHPATLAYNLYDFRWANICRIAKQAGFKSHDTETCGLHIHVGREEMGGSYDERERVARKLVLLVSVLKEDMVKFSRRKAAHLDHWASIPDIRTDGLSEAGLLDAAYNAVRYSRYMAVNLQNEHTVEFRLFRGTLKRDTICAATQLVSNLCKFAMSHTAVECTRATFADIINVEPTSVLLDYCVSRRLVIRTAA